jgi:hypothetical protein
VLSHIQDFSFTMRIALPAHMSFGFGKVQLPRRIVVIAIKPALNEVWIARRRRALAIRRLRAISSTAGSFHDVSFMAFGAVGSAIVEVVGGRGFADLRGASTSCADLLVADPTIFLVVTLACISLQGVDSPIEIISG